MLFSLYLTLCSAASVVDKAAFEAAISKPDQVLVAFTMPGCEQCEAFQPDFAEICQNRTCIQVDDINLGTKFQVEGFPTVAVFQNSYLKKFSPEKAAIIDFLKDLDTAPSLPAVADPAASWKKAKTAFAISAAAEATLAAEFRVARKFLTLADQVQYVETSEISNPLEISIIREGVVEFTMQWSAESAPMFRRILAGERVPLFAEVNRDNYELYEYLAIDRSPEFPGRGLVWVCFDAETLEEQREKNRPLIERVARSLRRNFSFVWVDTKIYGEEAQRQIGCQMDDAEKMPALIVHIPGERPANLRRHRFNGAAGIFDEKKLTEFFQAVLADGAEYFFRSKPEAELDTNAPVPEISSRGLEKAITYKEEDAVLIVGVTVKDRDLCDDACDKFISDLAVIRALMERKPGHKVRRIDGLENDPPRPFVFWENVPFLFVIKTGKQLRFPALSGDFSLAAMLSWLQEHIDVDSNVVQGDEAVKLEFIEEISDATLKAQVHKALFVEDEDDWEDNEDEVTRVTSTKAPVDEDWDDLDDEL